MRPKLVKALQAPSPALLKTKQTKTNSFACFLGESTARQSVYNLI